MSWLARWLALWQLKPVTNKPWKTCFSIYFYWKTRPVNEEKSFGWSRLDDSRKWKKGAIHYQWYPFFLTARLVCSSPTKRVFKVLIFWEGHIWNNLPLFLTLLSSVKEKWKIVSNFCGLFRMSVLYTTGLKKQNLLNINWWCWIYLFRYILKQRCSDLHEQTWTRGLGLNLFSVLFSFNWVDHD